jgi:hypothetical protein
MKYLVKKIISKSPKFLELLIMNRILCNKAVCASLSFFFQYSKLNMILQACSNKLQFDKLGVAGQVRRRGKEEVAVIQRRIMLK